MCTHKLCFEEKYEIYLFFQHFILVFTAEIKIYILHDDMVGILYLY